MARKPMPAGEQGHRWLDRQVQQAQPALELEQQVQLVPQDRLGQQVRVWARRVQQVRLAPKEQQGQLEQLALTAKLY